MSDKYSKIAQKIYDDTCCEPTYYDESPVNEFNLLDKIKEALENAEEAGYKDGFYDGKQEGYTIAQLEQFKELKE